MSHFSGEMARELLSLADAGMINVLDLMILVKDENGDVEAFEADDAPGAGEIVALEAEIAEILAAEDVVHLAEAMLPGTTAGVLVWENSWAAPFAVRRPACRWPDHRQRSHPHPGDRRLSRGGGRRTQRRRVRCPYARGEEPAVV